MNERSLGFLQAALAMAMVGGAVTASGFLADAPLFAVQAVRYALAVLVLALWAGRLLRRPAHSRVHGPVRSPVRRPVGREWWWLLASATAGQSGYNVAVLHAVQHAEPAAVGTVVAGVPLVLAVLVPLAHRRRPPRRLLAAAGVVVVGAAIVQGGGRTDATGVLLSVIALAGEVGFTLLALPILRRLGPLSVATHTAWIAAVQFAVLAVVLDGTSSLFVPSRSVLLAVLYLVAASAGAFALWFICVERVGGEIAGLAAGIIPIAAAGTGLLVGTTTIGLAVIGGSIVVAAGVAIGLIPARTSTSHESVSTIEAQGTHTP